MGNKNNTVAQSNEFLQLEKQYGNVKKLSKEEAQALVQTSHKIFEALDVDHSNYLEGKEREVLFNKIYEYAAPIFKVLFVVCHLCSCSTSTKWNIMVILPLSRSLMSYFARIKKRLLQKAYNILMTIKMAGFLLKRYVARVI